MSLYLNRTCPLVNKKNQVIGGQPWNCHDTSCRFQIDGVCAIIGSYIKAWENRRVLNEICKLLGLRRASR